MVSLTSSTHSQNATKVNVFLQSLKARNPILLKADLEEEFRDSYRSLTESETFKEFYCRFIEFFTLFKTYSQIQAPMMILPTLRYTVPCDHNNRAQQEENSRTYQKLKGNQRKILLSMIK